MINREEEQNYLNKNSGYRIEQTLLWALNWTEFKKLIKDFEKTYNIERSKLVEIYKKRISQDDYKNWNELERYLIKMTFHYFCWGVELNMNKGFIKKMKMYYRLHFTDIWKSRNFEFFDINSIPIREVIGIYCKLPDSLRRNIRCIFPDHRDLSSSFKIYENTNSFCCFWCWRKWNAVNFLSEIEGITTKEAFLKLKNLFINKN